MRRGCPQGSGFGTPLVRVDGWNQQHQREPPQPRPIKARALESRPPACGGRTVVGSNGSASTASSLRSEARGTRPPKAAGAPRGDHVSRRRPTAGGVYPNVESRRRPTADRVYPNIESRRRPTADRVYPNVKSHRRPKAGGCHVLAKQAVLAEPPERRQRGAKRRSRDKHQRERPQARPLKPRVPADASLRNRSRGSRLRHHQFRRLRPNFVRTPSDGHS